MLRRHKIDAALIPWVALANAACREKAAARGAMGPETFLPHVAGSITYTVVGYLGSRYFAFKKMSGIRLTDATTSI